MADITIVTAGIGNVGSVRNMLARLGYTATITDDPAQTLAAKKLILPGVGAFDAGMAALRARGLDMAVRRAVLDNGAQLLGICLGMQLLLESSEEGRDRGLGLVPGRVHRFENGRLRVPHMGWNVVKPTRDSTLLSLDAPEQRFYFVHSYYAECADPGDVAGTTSYGTEFVSVIEHGRVRGVQFHAEKSHRFGMALLDRFVRS
jgi:imidazole glycerol-phosphate synthase subunit HisH